MPEHTPLPGRLVGRGGWFAVNSPKVRLSRCLPRTFHASAAEDTKGLWFPHRIAFSIIVSNRHYRRIPSVIVCAFDHNQSCLCSTDCLAPPPPPLLSHTLLGDAVSLWTYIISKLSRLSSLRASYSPLYLRRVLFSHRLIPPPSACIRRGRRHQPYVPPTQNILPSRCLTRPILPTHLPQAETAVVAIELQFMMRRVRTDPFHRLVFVPDCNPTPD